MLKEKIALSKLSVIITTINLIFFHYPFFKYVIQNSSYNTFNGALLLVSLIIAMLLANGLVAYLFFYISKYLGKFLFTLFFIINAIALYFINTYGIIVDESMISNVFNTNSEESLSYFSLKMLFYVLFLGVLPSLFVLKVKYTKDNFKTFLKKIGILLITLITIAFINAPNWLWIDKNSKQLGGLAMPWSYAVNTSLHFIHEAQKNKKEIILPDAEINDNEKSVVVLIIGESARSKNFSLYGYERETNPELSKIENVNHFNATSSATYTTAGVKSILSHKESNDLYEILPNYLFRNNVNVVWRTTNWGEPPVHIKNYKKKSELQTQCTENCDYDEVLLTNLTDEIVKQDKNKTLIVLHTSTSHGPSYNKKYPKQFEVFTPVCESVELAKCTNQSLINAYDNTILYTDYLISETIKQLSGLGNYKTAVLYVSDHGESLGEKNLYMHGIPKSIAPKEQYEIPFIVWTSDSDKKLKSYSELNQSNVFHSILNFLNISSPIYNEELNIFLE